MGRTVVVRESYNQEIRKLDWMEKSIRKDKRIPDNLKNDASDQIEALKDVLSSIESTIGVVNVA